MRIIIIGEFSSFAKNLSEGFSQLGHDCFVFSWGDGFKKIHQNERNSYQISIRSGGRGSMIGLIRKAIYNTCSSMKLRRYVRRMSYKEKWDVVLIINPSFIKHKGRFWSALFTKGMIFSLLNDTTQVYMSACGSDIPFFDYWKDHLWKNHHLIELGINKYYTNKEKSHFEYCMSFINKVIPVMYMYAEAWRKSSYSKGCKVLQTIPLPLMTSIYDTHNVIGERVVIFHGVIRPEEKGTPLIVRAMDMLQTKYPDKVTCIVKGGMPLVEYLPLLNRTNILIDQAYSDYVGMNGLYAMAMGKVVLGGNVPENQKELGDYDCPIVNIEPNVDDIFRKLEDLILNTNKIITLSLESREYVERVHKASSVARKYIEIFNNTFE